MTGVAAGAFLILSAALLAGFFGQAIFRRFRVSDLLVLLVTGFTLGLFIDAPWLTAAMPILAPLGLVVILFEGGLSLRWEDLHQHGWGAAGFSLLSWTASVAALTAVGVLLLGLALPLAILFAVAVGATGIVAVIPILAQVRAPAKARVWLTVETGIGDLLSAVAVTGLASLYLFGGTPTRFGIDFAMRFLLGGAVGFLGGLAFARVLHHVRERAHAYPVVLGGLLLAYAVTETLGGSGYLSALIFGLVVGNASALMRDGGVPALNALNDSSRAHQGEIIFLLRSVYFVFLGMSIGRELLTWSTLLAALVLTGALVATRFLVVGLTHSGDARTGTLLRGMMPRAMAAAVLASIPAAAGVPGTEGFLALALLVIVGSDVATTVGLYVYERNSSARGKPHHEARPSRTP